MGRCQIGSHARPEGVRRRARKAPPDEPDEPPQTQLRRSVLACVGPPTINARGRLTPRKVGVNSYPQAVVSGALGL